MPKTYVLDTNVLLHNPSALFAIDHPYLDSSSNGLTCLVERLKAEEIAGHVTLVKGERSKVAELAARLL